MITAFTQENAKVSEFKLGTNGPCLVYCKKSVLKIQEYIHEGVNLKFYIPEFFNFKLLIHDYSPI
jgi:hypothetical protein